MMPAWRAMRWSGLLYLAPPEPNAHAAIRPRRYDALRVHAGAASSENPKLNAQI
jgi:hypothetical protein